MMDKAKFDYLRDFLKRRSGLVLEEAKAYLLETRMFPVLRQHDIASLEALADCVKQDEHGQVALDVIHAMTTNESLFFRDKYPFEALRKLILPEMESALPAFSRINIWSAACSRGQEPYSIAMTALQSLPSANRRVRITATDLDRVILQYAEEGRYSQMEVQRGLPIQLLVRHFDQHGEAWQIRDEVRSLVSFRYANLISDALKRDLGTADPFHVVFCRNVLIYFDPEERQRVIDRIADVMAPGAYLLTGAAETVQGVRSSWEMVGFENRRLWKLVEIGGN